MADPELNIKVQVLYDFEYQGNDTRWIWMKEGEKLTVSAKTNEDWWQVMRNGEKNPFYAPVSYLEVIEEDDVGLNVKNLENVDSGIADVSSGEADDRFHDVHPSMGSSDCNFEDLVSDQDAKEQRLSSSPSMYHNPIYTNHKFTARNEEVVVDTQDDQYSVDEDGNEIEKEFSSGPIYANFPPHIYHGEPPVPNQGDKPVKILVHHWAEYIDDQSRKFYFNSLTRQSSWKPPRRRLDRPSGSMNCFSANEDLNETMTNVIPAEPPAIIKRTSVFYDNLPQDDSLSLDNANKSKHKLTVIDKPKNKSDSNLNKDAAPSSEHLNVDNKKMHTWKSSPSIMRKFKMSIRGSPLMSRRKITNNNDDKQCSKKCANEPTKSAMITNPMYSSTDELNANKPSLPHGWVEEKSSSFEVYYVHSQTGEKWQSSVDESGRDYYYCVNGTESFWELPEIKSTENDTKKRYITGTSRPSSKDSHDLAPESATSDRNCKTKSLILNPMFDSDRKSRCQNANVSLDNKSVTLPRTSSPTESKHLNVLKEGVLNRTKVMESGKRKRKDWMLSLVILTPSRLIIYKDAKSHTSKQRLSVKPEMNIELCGSVINWCPEKSSKRNVFQIKTVLGVLLLLQDDNEEVASDWFNSTNNVISQLPSTFPMNHVVKSTSLTDMNNSDRNSKLPHSKSMKIVVKPHDQNDNCAASAAEKKKVKKKLKHFFLKRPTLESLAEKGIIQDEPVYGCDLGKLCSREGTTIPRFVQECIGAIEQRDIKAVGLYRASGNMSQIQRIRFQVNQDIFTGVHKEEDVHVLSGCLKMFFRHMKEPLIPNNVYSNLLAAIKLSKKKKRLKAIVEHLYHLQQPNFDTLRFLLQHLLRVTCHSLENKMQVQNLAIVFGPTIMGADAVSEDLAIDMMYQNQIIEFLLLEFDEVFKIIG